MTHIPSPTGWTGEPLPRPSLAKLRNDLRDCERTLQGYMVYDACPTGNPYADLREQYAAHYFFLKAQIAAFDRTPEALTDAVYAAAGGR